jgi:hypothetical protein
MLAGIHGGDDIGVDRAVESDDAAKGRGRVGLEGFFVGDSRLTSMATPQGLACLMITQAGVSKVLTHSQAASASAMLLYESSLPCNCR